MLHYHDTGEERYIQLGHPKFFEVDLLDRLADAVGDDSATEITSSEVR